MEELDRKDWYQFRSKNTTRVSRQEIKMIAELHSKYFNHKYKVPCSCSPKDLQKWVDDLNKIYESE
jgi:hypothetical protein